MKGGLEQQIRTLGRLLAFFASIFILLIGFILFVKRYPNIFVPKEHYEEISEEQTPLIKVDDATIVQSGFINDEGVSQVIQNCTQCHSSKLVTQNKMSKEGWENTISWMQETQNLWDLGDKQAMIVAYLAKNYGPEPKGRRQNLTNINWYELE